MSSGALSIVDSQPLPAAVPNGGLSIVSSQPLPSAQPDATIASSVANLPQQQAPAASTSNEYSPNTMSLPRKGGESWLHWVYRNLSNNTMHADLNGPMPGSTEGPGLLRALAPLSKPAAIVAGTVLAPELAPEAGLVGRAALTGLGAGAGTVAGQAATGQNPITKPSLEETGLNAATGAGTDLLLGGASKLLQSKLARGMINESVGATARDVTYGNPAKALLNENITSPITGDLEAYKDALRSGASQDEAMEAAGGRAAAVTHRIAELSPELDSMLGASKQPIKVSDVIDRPLIDAANQIISNRAMTQAEKDAAITQLGELQKSLKEGLPNKITPLQANEIKQALGHRINWAGNIAVTDEVKPAYRAVYASLKNAVHNAVPDAAPIDERLTNLLAARTDLEKLMKAEEVGQGKGALGSAVTGIARRAEAVAGRAIPTASRAARLGQRIIPPAAANISGVPDVTVTNAPSEASQ